MQIPLGRVVELVRYPVKSMAGIPTDSASLGWHGLDGDRRFAFRRLGDEGGFPWLTASRFPELVLYQPLGLDYTSGEPLPTRVCTPSGAHVDLRSAALQSEIATRCGMAVELMKLKHGIFDEAPVSMISRGTVARLGREAEVEIDHRRFRPNIVLELHDSGPFREDEWVGASLVFGEREPAAAVNVTMHDVRCMMINLDPETARPDVRVLKTVVRLNANRAGVYGTVLRPGTIRVGQEVSLVTNVSG